MYHFELNSSDVYKRQPVQVANMAEASAEAAYPLGAVSYTHLDVYKRQGQKREDAAGPAVGRGVSAIAGEKETQVFSCAPVLVKDPEDAVLAVCRVCNSVAAAGASAKGVLVSLMLPEAMEERNLKELMRAVDGACVRYGTAVIGGHTEVTDGILYPVLTVTAAGGTLSLIHI